MPRKQVSFMDKTYRTKGEFKKFVTSIIYGVGVCSDIKNTFPSEYEIILKILERHPEFADKTVNMKNLKIQHNKLNKTALEIMIIKKDDSQVDISWNIAIDGCLKGHKQCLTGAMRSSVQYQIRQFKSQNGDKCCLCGKTENPHVDHNDEVGSAFDELAHNFINAHKHLKIPTEFDELNDNTHRQTFKPNDNEFKNKWMSYHKQHAQLRILCKSCNIRRPKTKNKLKL